MRCVHSLNDIDLTAYIQFDLYFHHCDILSLWIYQEEFLWFDVVQAFFFMYSLYYIYFNDQKTNKENSWICFVWVTNMICRQNTGLTLSLFIYMALVSGFSCSKP